MKILLTKKESEKFFFRALHGGLSYLHEFNLELIYKESDYQEAKKKLEEPFYVDIIIQLLKDGKNLNIFDHESALNSKIINLDYVHENMGRIDLYRLYQMHSDNYDSVTCFDILQTIFYGEVIFG